MPSPFLQSVSDAIRVRYYSIKTEQTYPYWIKYYIRFHKKQHPKNLNEQHIQEFLLRTRQFSGRNEHVTATR